MSTVKDHKRKPFGPSAENALNSKKQSVRKDGPKHDGRGGTSTTRFDPEKRRESKTPKMGNLTSASGAYDPKKELEAARPRGGKRDRHEKTARGHRPASKLDPSPIKRPDPTTSFLRSATNRPANSTKRDGGFVAASLKRLFPSKNSNMNQPRAKTHDCGRPIGPNSALASSDMNTVCSTPQKDSPLVMSPLTKPDPIAKDEEGDVLDRIEETCLHVEQNTKQPYYDPKTQPRTDKISFAGKAVREEEGMDDHPRSVPKEALDRFRNGPTDDKRILDVMFKSCNGRPCLRPEPAQQKASMESLVGSTVGGSSLQRSDSADESEVTTFGCVHENSSQTSMTTCFDRHEADRDGVTNDTVPYRDGRLNSVRVAAQSQSMFRGKILPTAAPSHQELCRANVINDRMTSEQSLARQSHLPAGWKVRWSKTKQQPYWVHPDFGSTWHCPGLIPNVGQATGRIELYNDQLISEGMQIRPSAYPRPSTVVANHIMANNSALTDESDTASHMARVLHGVGSGVKSAIDEYAMPECADATFTVQTMHAIRCNSQENFNSYAHDGEAEEKISHRGAKKATENFDVSSADVSTKCFTQDFESRVHEEDEIKSTSECYYEKEKQQGDDPVELEYYQYDGNNHRDDASQEQFNAEQDDTEEAIDQEDNDEDDGASVIDTINSGGSSAIDSLMSEYVDVDVLLQNGGKNVKSSLATIKEYHQDSDGYQSSEASYDGSKEPQKAHTNLRRSFEESSEGEDTSAIDFGASIGMDNEVHTSIRSDSEDSHESNVYEPREQKTKTRNSSRSHRSNKKFFPPGPLCSLQFLEEIEKKEFDTPLWRRMKRKRSTLSSVRAQKDSRRRSFS